MAEPSSRPASDTETREVVRTRLTDPDVKARVEEIKRIIASGEPQGAGITAEDLPAFLREHLGPT